MQTLRDAMLVLQGHLTAGRITEDEYKQAVRERLGRTLSQSGRLLPKRAWIGTEVNGERALPASQASVKPYSRSTKLWTGKPAPEVQERDFRIRYDREMVAAGCRSALVKVVKGNARPVTAMQIAMDHGDKAVEVADVMAMLKAAVSAAE